MAKVSVLIAVYNAAPFLPQCLDSLIGQTHVDWQAVCVDDASTDTSLSVLQSYAQRDSRFEVIHLPQNVGLAKARNVALKRVDGDYVCMLDADDWLSSDAFQQAVDVFSQHAQTDCVLFRFVYTYQEADGYRYEEFKSHADAPVLSGAEACRLSLKWKIHGLYMVRASLQHRFPYDDTCRLFSDENTTRIHYAHSREIRFCDGYY